jgi:hypothetical protein
MNDSEKIFQVLREVEVLLQTLPKDQQIAVLRMLSVARKRKWTKTNADSS